MLERRWQRHADTSTSVQLIQRQKCSTGNICMHMLSEGFQIDWIQASTIIGSAL